MSESAASPSAASPSAASPSAASLSAASPSDAVADVIVVGAGPAGSSAAYHLARHGVDVLLLEKSEFPREKVCGDGLTPRAVRQLIGMGVDIDAEGWQRNSGVRFYASGLAVEIDWPESARFPGFGLTRSRHDFDELLARQAVKAGARLWTSAKVMEPVLDRNGRVRGVRAHVGPEKRPVTCEAPLVIAADGVSTRLAVALGVTRVTRRPMATAIRRYYRSPSRHDDPYLDIWADLRERHGAPLIPGYGWIFPMGDGRVNVGLGVIGQRSQGSWDTRALLDTWLARTPAGWGLRGEENAEGPLRGAALPMGHNRLPHYTRGMLLVGDAGGMVSPWNGEGIPYAMESGEVAAETAVYALARPAGPWRERILQRYPREIQRRNGGYYRLGNGWAALLRRPALASFVSRRVVTSPATMRVVIRLLTNLMDDRGDAVDRALSAAVRVVPVTTRAPRTRGSRPAGGR
ncbi:geranylgeranyl reductase family protein [Streptomyces radicis]|uniref:Geranylgeranyl reductase family protein n=1 Tax=Streptomyces radicis TaxID=1750517 RepID=A0A3A9WER6_9ACTN|nr:geranylgeranyl reductase family protein [Streptomyces radicis]RKN07914.1 geranylgeranyl reductase family protein [Streptomyces radicis]RKN20632.1 geranylgeranyl reductase family protein [Streptomyces radicis]